MTTQFLDLYSAAQASGKAAAVATIPVPMLVIEKSSTGDNVYRVPEGVCGFAWVSIAGNTAFGRWAKKTGRASKAYGGGLQIWMGGYGQSLVRKEAHARAMAEYLSNAGIKAYAQSRMD